MGLKQISGILKDQLPAQIHISKKWLPLKQNTVSGTQKKGNIFDFVHLYENWGEIVGEYLSNKSAPKKIFNKQLIVMVSHSAIAHQMSFSVNTLISRMKERFPPLGKLVKEIKFQVSPQHFQLPEENNLFVPTQSKKSNTTHIHSPSYILQKKSLSKIFNENISPPLNQDILDLLVSLEIQRIGNNK